MGKRVGGYSGIVGTISDTSPASESTAAGDIVSGLENYEWFTVDAALVGATDGALDIYLQRDVNGTWVDWFKFPQLAAGASAIRYTVDSAVSPTTAQTTVGSGTSPVITGTVFTCKHPGNSVRALYVAGAGTSAGAAVSITITGWQTPH